VPVKIVFANSMKGLGGGERWLLNAARGLGERGHRVWVSGRSGAPLLDRAAALGTGVLPAPYAGDVDPATVRALRGFFEREAPDVVVAQIQRAHRLCAVASLLGPRVRLALRVGQLRAVGAKLANRLAWGATSMVFANCEAIRADLARTGLVAAPRLRLLYTGLPPLELPARAASRAALGLAPGDEAVVCVARLALRKGHDTLLEAWPRVRAARPRAVLLLAGGGSEEAALRARAAAPELAGSVRFLGELEDVGPVWAAADLSVLPSQLEGLPHAVLESMGAGVACVATRVAGVPEMLTHEVSGLLVPARDPGALAREIARGLADPSLRSRLAAAAAREAARKFGFGTMLDRLEASLCELAGSRHGA
jgi:glycosyltransferase involved in cell wall biosynthesis